MKSPDWNLPLAVIDRSRTFFSTIVLLGVVAGASSASAQSVISAPPVISHVPASLPQAPASDSASSTTPGSSPFQWELVTLRPHLSYRYLYGDGLLSSPGNRTTTSIQSISPGVLFDLGTHWTLDYTATKSYYSDPAFKDTLDHSVVLTAGATLEDWIMKFSQTFSSASPTLIETGRQTKETDYVTFASASHHFGNKTQEDTSVSYQVRSGNTISNSKDYTVTERLHYQYSKRLDASVGLGFGRTDVNVGSDMTYVRPDLQVDWKASDKVSLSLQGGYETRKFLTGGAANLNSPTFGASIQYQPFTTTSISVGANRSVAASYFQNQVTKNTSWNVNLQQRLLLHYYLSAGYTGQNSDYVATDPALTAGRNDRNHTFTLRLSTTFFQRATVAISYQNTHNASDVGAFAFNSSQIGFDVSYRY